MRAIPCRLGLAVLLCTTPLTTARAKPKTMRATSGMEVVSGSVNATCCENSACEPVSLSILTGESFIMYRWALIASPFASPTSMPPLTQANCVGERSSAQRAVDRLAHYLNRATFTMARLHADQSGTIAFVSIDSRDLGHMLSRDRVVWPWEYRHRSWC